MHGLLVVMCLASERWEHALRHRRHPTIGQLTQTGVEWPTREGVSLLVLDRLEVECSFCLFLGHCLRHMTDNHCADSQ